MRDILDRVTSDDVAVLEQSLAFVLGRAAQEAERAKVAETRATAMLAVLGILAGLIVPLIESIGGIVGDSRWFLMVAFLACLLFLIRGLFYAIKVLSVMKQYRLKPETVYDFQTLSPEDALREEIAATLWECTQAVVPNSEKLFWLNRSQRNGLMAIILFIVFGMLLVAAKEQWICPPLWASTSLGIVAIGLLFFTDKIVECYGIWGHSNGGKRDAGTAGK